LLQLSVAAAIHHCSLVAAAIGHCSLGAAVSVAAAFDCCSYQLLQWLVAAAIVIVVAAVVAALFLRPVCFSLPSQK